jgi:hypothetical protein
VSSKSAAYASASPSAVKVLVPGPDALRCLKSVPVDVEGNRALLDSLGAYWEFQSNLQYLKIPPATWSNPPVDILGGLRKIGAALADGQYKDEYTFQNDISQLANKANDGHFSWVSDIGSVFRYSLVSSVDGEIFRLVSISKDGKSIPSVYLIGKWHPSPSRLRFLVCLDGANRLVVTCSLS